MGDGGGWGCVVLAVVGWRHAGVFGGWRALGSVIHIDTQGGGEGETKTTGERPDTRNKKRGGDDEDNINNNDDDDDGGTQAHDSPRSFFCLF